jgi:hypothetical protein
MSKQAGRMSQGANDFLAPYAPTIGTATNVPSGRAYNNGRIDVTFTPDATYAATSYTVTAVEDASKTATGSSSPISVTGLASNTSYTFKVTATNSYGTSANSAATSAVTATTVPDTVGTPSVSTVAIGGASAQGSANTATDTVSWSAPANGGSAITNYHWTSSDGKSGDTASTSVAVSQESGTAQTYTVYATNTNGNGGSGTSGSITSAFSFTPFGFTPFGFTPFGFTPFGAFGFTPFGAFGFTPFSFVAFGFSPFGFAPTFGFNSFGFAPNFYAFGFTPGPGWSDSLNINVPVRTADGTKLAKDVVVGDKLLALNISDGENLDWLNWTGTEELITSDKIVETTVVSVDLSSTSHFVYIDGDIFAKTHYILTKKDDVVKFTHVADIDTTYQIYSYEDAKFIDIEIVEEIEAEMQKVSINCEPYDNFFTDKMLVFDRADFPK